MDAVDAVDAVVVVWTLLVVSVVDGTTVVGSDGMDVCKLEGGKKAAWNPYFWLFIRSHGQTYLSYLNTLSGFPRELSVVRLILSSTLKYTCISMTRTQSDRPCKGCH